MKQFQGIKHQTKERVRTNNDKTKAALETTDALSHPLMWKPGYKYNKAP